MRGLLLAVPSRGRPGNIARLHDAMQATCQGDTTLVVGLDEDDPCLPEYLWHQNEQGWAAVIRRGLRSVVPWINAIAMPRARYYRAIGHIGDDNVPMTDDWDVRVMSALEHAPFAFCNDLYPRPPGSLSCHVFMQSEVARRLGYFSPPEPVHMYCVAPETPVLTAGLRWMQAGRIAVGDELVGVDEYPLVPRCKRKYRRARVTGTTRRMAQCVRVELEDGRQVTCSADHRWLAVRRWKGTGQHGPGQHEWRPSDQLRPGDQILSPLRVWDEETSFEAGWLAGIFDGEATACRSTTHGRWPSDTLAVGQNPGPVLDRIERDLKAMGMSYTFEKKRYYKDRDGVVVLRIVPRSARIELLGRLQASRLRGEVAWEDLSIMARDSGQALARVTRMIPVGNAEVVSMQTSTGTFLANGLVAHNCDVIWMAWGTATRIIYLHDTIIEHRHFTTGKAPFDESYRLSSARIPADLDAYHAYCRDQLNADLLKISPDARLYTPEMLRQFNVSLNIPPRWGEPVC